MTTELVVLLAIFVFVTLTAFFGPNGPIQVYKNSGPKLAARIENQISSGTSFSVKQAGTSEHWIAPSGPSPLQGNL
jgi:hypothetical protein